MRLRQVAIAVRELDSAVEDIRAVLGVEVCFTPDDEIALRGPALIERFGLRNAVFAMGDTFLELITPTRPDTTIERFLRDRGDSGYMVLVQCPDLAAARKRAAGLGIREVWQAPLADLDGVHLDPRDTGGSFLSLDQPDDPAEWPWAGVRWRDAVRTDVTAEIVGARVASAAPAVVAARWGELLDRPVVQNGETSAVSLDRGHIRFPPAASNQADALRGVDVRCPDPDEVRRRARARGVPLDASGSPILAGLPFTLVAG